MRKRLLAPLLVFALLVAVVPVALAQEPPTPTPTETPVIGETPTETPTEVVTSTPTITPTPNIANLYIEGGTGQVGVVEFRISGGEYVIALELFVLIGLFSFSIFVQMAKK